MIREQIDIDCCFECLVVRLVEENLVFLLFAKCIDLLRKSAMTGVYLSY